MDEIDIRTNQIRRMRKVSAYEPGSPTPEQIANLNALLDEVMPAAYTWLVAERPTARFTPYRP
ncbi:MAG TPA: hypothetical protein VHG08_16025 [Longimicrobium sp.]|nr:hypothetical protein [Longimicrobium sp.]